MDSRRRTLAQIKVVVVGSKVYWEHYELTDKAVIDVNNVRFVYRDFNGEKYMLARSKVTNMGVDSKVTLDASGTYYPTVRGEGHKYYITAGEPNPLINPEIVPIVNVLNNKGIHPHQGMIVINEDDKLPAETSTDVLTMQGIPVGARALGFITDGVPDAVQETPADSGGPVLASVKNATFLIQYSWTVMGNGGIKPYINTIYLTPLKLTAEQVKVRNAKVEHALTKVWDTSTGCRPPMWMQDVELHNQTLQAATQEPGVVSRMGEALSAMQVVA